jgi:oxygen-independent coproporphyrinogen-3 oxidase
LHAGRIADFQFPLANCKDAFNTNRQSTIDNQTVSRRYKNISDIAGYVRMMDELGHAEAESETIEGETLMLEIILMQLRLNEGLSIEAFSRRTSCDPRLVFAGTLDRMSESDLLTCSDTHVALTRQGFLKANHVISELAASMRSPTSLVV